jgi:beta-glucosidase
MPRAGDKPGVISPEWRAHHERLLRAPGRKTAQLLFVGDSITEGWGVAPAFREYFARYSPFNLGIAGDTTQNVLWRIEHGALDGTAPKAVVLLIGVNNLGGGFSAEDTADGVRATVAAVRARLPETRVVLLAILPARQEPENPLRLRIRETNRLLEGLVEPEHVEFHDLGSVLLEADGRLSGVMTRDFLHPTLEGFKQLSGALAPLLEPIFREPPAQ